MRQIISLGLGVVLMSGCVSVLPEQVVPDALYRLNAPTVSPTIETTISLPYSVTVFEPEGSALLLGRAMVFEDEKGALTVFSAAQWSDPAGRQLQSLLIDHLMIRDADDDSLVVSDKLGAFTQTDLKWRVTDFVVRKQDAHISAQVTLIAARSRKVLSQFTVEETVPYKGKPQENGVLALKQASQSMMAKIASQLPEDVDQTALKAVSRRR